MITSVLLMIVGLFQLLVSRWLRLVIWSFQGIGSFLLSCQIYEGKVVGSIYWKHFNDGRVCSDILYHSWNWHIIFFSLFIFVILARVLSMSLIFFPKQCLVSLIFLNYFFTFHFINFCYYLYNPPPSTCFGFIV